MRATKVLDTMIHAGQVPPMAAVFVMPGRLSPGAAPEDPVDFDPRDRDQRSFEYDSVTPRYGQFLVDEVLPLAARQLGVSFSSDPAERAVCGISSGGICAFNTAWHHPHAFGLVVSHCGSFVNIRGGHNFPYLIRSTPKKPIRMFLTTGKRDGNIILGNWPLANQQMASALAYAGYDHRFELGEGGHSLRHGGALFGETMRWLWSGA
ncbi:MAG: alpha/beta hydrolase-fold protein [Gammaproteobacteria bacterium]|nr:alpha/beta hydrolase-fold protein [Gammaproteobacteria bacterium]